MRTRPVVAIDGPAGAGKSTVARRVAAELGFVFVDTGALYRSVALAASEAGVEWTDGAGCGRVASGLKVEFRRNAAGDLRVFLDGEDREDAIRTPKAAEGASRVSQHAEVREALLGLQRQMGADGGVVLEGRDIGTVVFPNAEVKVFLTASPEARAERRQRDLEARGVPSDFSELLSAMKARDARDRERALAPLVAAADAVEVDSTKLSQEEVIAEILRLAKAASGQQR